MWFKLKLELKDIVSPTARTLSKTLTVVRLFMLVQGSALLPSLLLPLSTMTDKMTDSARAVAVSSLLN